MSTHGQFHWNELMTTDADAARSFYQSVVGWEVNVMSFDDVTKPAADGEQGYTVWMTGDNPSGGMMQMQGPEFEGVPPHWACYIHVDDVDAASAKAEELGGTVIKAVFEVPNVGKIAIVQDPQGAVIGLITPANA